MDFINLINLAASKILERNLPTFEMRFDRYGCENFWKHIYLIFKAYFERLDIRLDLHERRAIIDLFFFQ